MDIEIISFRASDIETKIITNQKEGKEKTVNDFVVCFLISILYGIGLEVMGEK